LNKLANGWSAFSRTTELSIFSEASDTDRIEIKVKITEGHEKKEPDFYPALSFCALL